MFISVILFKDMFMNMVFVLENYSYVFVSMIEKIIMYLLFYFILNF